MTDSDEPQYRTYHQPDPDDVEVREPEEGSDGVFDIRMPVVTTGEVRNEGDEPFEREALEGMAAQINEGTVATFLDHGGNPDVAGSRYSATEKVGVWRDAEVETREADDEAQVTATASLMDPETLPGETGALREMLARVKAQIERGIPQATSIGWNVDEDAPGGNDLWEVSIVGIPADPRTTEEDVAVAAARDVLGDIDLEASERERLVEEFRAVVMGSNAEGSNARDSVTDDDTESPDAESGDDSRDEQDGLDEQEYRESMLEMQRTQTETLETLAAAIREDDEDDEEEDEDEDEQEGDHDDEEDDDEEQAADVEQQSIEIDGEERTVGELVEDHRTALEELRENGLSPEDLDVPEPEEGQDADDEGGEERSTDAEPSFSFTEDHE